MTEFLDHAITVRDVLYSGLAGIIVLGAIATWVHPPYVDRRARRRRMQAENLRNPVYGIPKGREK